MAGLNQVVVRYKDGKVLKGTTDQFYPDRQAFQLLPDDGTSPVSVKCESLKAVFFVKDLRGNPLYDERPEFLHSPGDGVRGKKIAVRFNDGEVVFGHTAAHVPGTPGFFLTPADPHSNNERVYVVTSATVDVRVGSAADEIVQHTLAAVR